MTGTPAEALADRLLAAGRGSIRPFREQLRACPEVADELKRRTDAALAVDLREALRVARVARAAGRTTGLLRAQAVGEHAVAKANHAGGRYAAAAQAYTRASAGYAELGDKQLQAKIRLALVDVLMHLGRHQEAEQTARQAHRSLLQVGDRVGAAKTLANLANLRHAQDRHQDAVKLLERARKVMQAAGQQTGVALIEYNMANSYAALARFDRSTPLYTRARRIFQELGQQEQVAIIDYNLAYDHFLQGRFHDARRLLATVRPIFRRSGSQHRLALAALDQSEIDLALNQPDSAAEASAEARSAFLQMGMGLEAARATLFGAEAARLQGDEATAQSLLEEARSRFARARHRPGTAAADLAMASLASEPASRRQARALRAARVYDQFGMKGRQATALVVAGSVALERGNNQRAAALLGQASTAARRRGLPEVELRCEHALARADETNSMPGRALRHYQRAMSAYERLRSGIRSDADRLAFAADKSVIFEDAVRLALDTGRLEQAFDSVERARSRALVDLLTTDPGFAASTLDRGGTLAKRLGKLKRRLTELEARAQAGERREGVVPADMRRQVRSAVTAYEHSLARLGEAAPQSSYALSGRPVATLEQIRAELGQRALLAYFTEGDSIGALVLTSERVEVRRTIASITDVRRSLRTLQFAVGTPRVDPQRADKRRAESAGAAYAALDSLGRQLFEPLLDLVADRDLAVIPPASLHLVPFHAVSQRGRPLIEDREVSVAPSATVLVWALRRRPTSRGSLVVAHADAAAPAIADEARAVVRTLGGRLLENRQATAQAVRREAARARVLHLATHGVYDPAEPLLSGIELADGRLTVLEIACLELDAALVTLSTCDSARGTPTGDELLGLVRAFLHAGTSSVVASLWAVHDSTTAALMETFYKRLGAGATVGDAMRRSVIEFRSLHPHPYHWAPFVLVGSWRGLKRASRVE